MNIVRTIMRYAFYPFGWLMLVFIISSCEQDVGPIIIDPVVSDPVSYNTEIRRIFDVNCRSCHDEEHQYLDLRPCCSYDQLWSLGTNAPYVEPDNPGQSKLYQHLTGELLLMPVFGPLPDHEIDLVLRWIKEGALNN